MAGLFVTDETPSAENRPVCSATPSAVDPGVVAAFLAAQRRGAESAPSHPTNKRLMEAGILTALDGRLHPTLFGLMAFGRQPQLHAGCFSFLVACCAYGGEDRASEVLLVGEANGRLDDQIERCLGWMRSLGWGERYDGIRRADLHPVPPVVVREALANAVAHRDYGIKGSKVMLEVFSDRLVVTSPGALPCGATPDSVVPGGAPKPRNPRMVEALMARRFMTGRGSGWPRLRDAMAEFNGTAPELVSEEGQFTRVTLRLGVA